MSGISVINAYKYSGMYRFTTTSSTKLSAVSRCILFKFEEGSWHECRKAIEAMHKEDSNAYLRLFNEEEEYDKYLRSESALMKLLTFVSLVCILDLFVRNILIGYIICETTS